MGRLTVASCLVALLSFAGVNSGGNLAAQEGEAGIFSLENGDTNADGTIDLSDAVGLLNFLFSDGRPPVPILPAESNLTGIRTARNGDSNGDGEIDVSDVVSLLSWLYLGGPAPAQFWSAGDGLGASSGFQRRPIEDFVSQQGTFCFFAPPPDCFLRDPPVANFFATTDPAALLCMSVDYAGLADDFAEGAFGTTTDGLVLERELTDGRAQVVVRLFTRNALTYVIEAIADPDGNFAGCDLAGGTLVFGERAPAALDGGGGAFGRSFLQVEFTNTAPGAPLPDFLQLAIAPEPGQVGPTEFLFATLAQGPLPDGRSGIATNVQIVRDSDGDGLADNIIRETIRVRPVGQR